MANSALVTERARKLRAQYALHAQGLRSRLEMRINRIPLALREKNIMDLVNQHAQPATAKAPAPKPALVLSERSPEKPRGIATTDSRPTSRGTKRSRCVLAYRYASPVSLLLCSDEMSNKENQQQHDIDLNNPKKRTKTAAAPSSSAAAGTRPVSRGKLNPMTILSPKSPNSRTLPQSPLRNPLSPSKSFIGRPASPLKPSTTASIASTLNPGPNKLTKRATSRQATNGPTAVASTAGGRGKRGATATMAPPPPVAHKEPRSSAAASDSSAGTTIVRKTTKTTTTTTTKKAAVPRSRVAAAKSAIEKVPAPSATGPPATRAGRVLRSRK